MESQAGPDAVGLGGIQAGNGAAVQARRDLSKREQGVEQQAWRSSNGPVR